MSRPQSHSDLGLPPPSAFLFDFEELRHDKLPTPIDERGLVNTPQLIENVKSVIDPNYRWPQGRGSLSVHHIYYPAFWYPHEIIDGANLGTFRNLPINKGLFIRQFENLVHEITEPANVPRPAVMKYQIESWSITHDLFKTVRSSIQLERLTRWRRKYIAENPQIVDEGFDGRDVIGEEIMQEMFEKNFRGLQRHFERNEKLPEPHRLFDPEKPLDEIAKTLGKVVLPRSVNYLKAIAA